MYNATISVNRYQDPKTVRTAMYLVLPVGSVAQNNKVASSFTAYIFGSSAKNNAVHKKIIGIQINILSNQMVFDEYWSAVD